MIQHDETLMSMYSILQFEDYTYLKINLTVTLLVKEEVIQHGDSSGTGTSENEYQRKKVVRC